MISGLNMTVDEPLSSKRMIRLLTPIMFAAIPTRVSLLTSKVSLISCATDKSASVAGVDFWARKLGSFATGLIIASLEPVSQCRGLGNAVRLVNIADREYTGDEHLAHNRPLIQGSGALKRLLLPSILALPVRTRIFLLIIESSSDIDYEMDFLQNT